MGVVGDSGEAGPKGIHASSESAVERGLVVDVGRGGGLGDPLDVEARGGVVVLGGDDVLETGWEAASGDPAVSTSVAAGAVSSGGDPLQAASANATPSATAMTRLEGLGRRMMCDMRDPLR
jgi:hypothetical protein